MVPETFAQALRAFVRRSPFKPFMVELVNGERIVVEHPEALAFHAGAAVYIRPRREFALFDHETVADVRNFPASSRSRRGAG